MRKVVLSDGKEFEINMCGAADGILWIGFPEGVLDFAQAVTVLSDVKATGKIVSTYDFDGMETVFEGYTELIHIQKEYDGGLLIALRMGQVNGEQ